MMTNATNLAEQATAEGTSTVTDDPHHNSQPVMTLAGVLYALALTAFLGSVLFVLAGINPKAAFGNAPWIYAGVCAVLAIVLGFAHWRVDRRTNDTTDEE